MALAVTLVDAILPNIYQFLSKWYLMGTSVALKLLLTAPSPLLHTHTHTQSTKLGTQGEWKKSQWVQRVLHHSSVS